MKLNYRFNALFVLFSIALLSRCEIASEGYGEEGSITISIEQVDSVITTRLTPQDLTIRLENTLGDTLKVWDNVEDIPDVVKVVEGSYQLIAWCGSREALPSFGGEYYEGSNKFSVEQGQSVAVPVVVKHGETKVAVEFDEASFSKFYSSYYAEVKTTTADEPLRDSLVYTPETTEIGNFLPGTLRIRLNLTSIEDGKQYVFYPTPITGLRAAEMRTLRLRIVSTTGETSLNITTDDGYDYTEEIDLTLPGSILPKSAPTITARGYVATEAIEGYEANIPQESYSAVLLAPAGIKSVKIRTESPTIRSMWGGRSEVELVGASLEMTNLLRSMGFEWDESLQSAESASEKYGKIEVSYGDLFGSLLAEPSMAYTDYLFEIEVVDVFDQSNKNNSTGLGLFNFTLRVKPPVFGWSTPTDANVWSSHAEFDIYSMTNTVNKPMIYIKEGEDGEWQIAKEQSFEQQSGSEAGTGVQRVDGLKSGVQYTFRLQLDAHSTEEFTAVSESPQVVENGDMESWNTSLLSLAWGNDIPTYNPWASGTASYWDTNNDRTVSYANGVTGYAYNTCPAVSYTYQACNGKYAAEIRTTSASDINPLNTTSINQDASKTAGLLLIGDYQYVDKQDVIYYGRPFSTRPESFSFNYTYTHFDGNDAFTAEIIVYGAGGEIGRGTYTSPKGVSVGNYQNLTVNINYSNRRARATSMAIVFRSTNLSPAPSRKEDLALDYENSEEYKELAAWWGAVLRVDDIVVNY